MSRSLDDLTPEFKTKVESVLAIAATRGVIMKPFFTLRSVYDQAKLWRQSRTTAEIRGAIDMLHKNGAPFLASVLDGVGPQSGRWATNALPAFSWHQHGEAVDCYWDVFGKTEWNATHDPDNGYEVYATLAKEQGLEAGHFWSAKAKDSVHIQLRAGSVEKMLERHGLSMTDLDNMMKEKFGV